MSMICGFHAISDAHLNRLLDRPPLVLRVLAGDDEDASEETVETPKPTGLLGRLFGKQPDGMPAKLKLSADERYEFDIDKAWQGIHYCLNGTPIEAEPPMDFLTTGGRVIGDVDVGYGPARGYYSDEVFEIYDRIIPMYREQLRTHYDPKKMHELDIYPDIWEGDAEAGFDYIAENFGRLKQFVSYCVDNELGMLIYLS